MPNPRKKSKLDRVVDISLKALAQVVDSNGELSAMALDAINEIERVYLEDK